MTFKFLQKKSVDAIHNLEEKSGEIIDRAKKIAPGEITTRIQVKEFVEKVTTDTKSDFTYSCEQLAHLTFDVSRKAHTVLTNPDHPHTKSLGLSQDTFASLHRDCGRGDSHTKNLFTGVCKKTNMFSDSTCEQFHRICDKNISATYSTDDQERTEDDAMADAICSELKKIHNDGPVRLNSSDFYERKIPIQLNVCPWYDLVCLTTKITPPAVVKKISNPKTYTEAAVVAAKATSDALNQAGKATSDALNQAGKATSDALNQAGKSISEAFTPGPCENECGCGTLDFDTDTPGEWIAKLWECQGEFEERGLTKNYTSVLGIAGSVKNKTCVLAGEAALSVMTKGKSDILEVNKCGILSTASGLSCEGIGQTFYAEEGPAGEAALAANCTIVSTAFDVGCEALFDAIGVDNDFTNDENWNKILETPSLLIQTICNATAEAPALNSFYPCTNRKERC